MATKPKKLKPKRPPKKSTGRRPKIFGGYNVSKLEQPCWQCDLDIGHVCFASIPNAKWGIES